MTAQLAFHFDKRWESRQERWRAPGETFDPAGFAVDVLDGRDERLARAFVVEHHYSGTFPAARLSVGLYHGRRLAGVAVFSVPMQKAVVPRYTGLQAADGVELGRFVLLPEVAYNGESWFLARAMRLLRSEKGCRAIVSYADPMERHGDDGLITKPSHYGTIYQASNATFAGRAAARWMWVDRDGRAISGRAISKIRLREVGCAYAERQLVAFGADERRPFEEPAAWLVRVLREPTFRRIRHPGNFAYVFGLDRSAKAAIAEANKLLPYPQKVTL